MMRLILAALLALPVYTFAQADKKLAVFGKVDKADLELKNCEFDKDAEALVLSEYGESRLDVIDGTLFYEFQHHVRIKILKDKGKDRGDIKLSYFSYRNSQGIKNLSANTYNLDDKGNIITTKLEKDLIYDKRINIRTSEKSFTMPEVKAGSIIEYKYTIVNSRRSNWYLQKSIPVRYSKFEIDFPDFVELYIKPFCTHPYVSKDISAGLRTRKMFSMENIPAFRNEEYITNEDDYLQRIESHIVAVTVNNIRRNTTTTWTKIAKELFEDEDFGLQLTKEIPRTADLDAELAKVNDNYAKMVIIHNYVRKNMEWDGIYSIWALDGVKAAWKQRKGNSGEINLILINLLKDAGIRAHPVMVSTRDNGWLSTDYPDYNNFNKVLAYVEINNKAHILDGTDKYTPAHLIPEDIMCTEGFVLDEKQQYKFKWTQFWDSVKTDKNFVVMQGWINGEGKMTGKATIKSYDYAKIKRLPHVKSGTSSFLSKFYMAHGNLINTDSLVFNNELVDTLPLEQVFNFNVPISQSGDYSYFSPNLVTGLKSNPFVVNNRYSDIFFGTNQSFTILGNFNIPENYTFEELPKNVRFSLEDKSLTITRMVAVSGNILNTKITIDCKRPYYSPEEYPNLMEFYKKMFALIDEQIVIKKKNS